MQLCTVFKKDDVHLAENYRPVSLTSVCCKLLEHIICKHLLNHLDKNNILTNLNHGFRAGFSCETQLLVTMNDLLHARIQKIFMRGGPAKMVLVTDEGGGPPPPPQKKKKIPKLPLFT